MAGTLSVVVGLLCLAIVPAQSAPRILNRAIDVHRMPVIDAAAGHPVVVRGVVTQSMPEWQGFTLQDATDAVYVSGRHAGTSIPSVGQEVVVNGRTGSGNFAPIIEANTVRVTGMGRPPTPHVADWKFLSSGACDNDYVEVTGIVRSAALLKPPRWWWAATEMHLDLGGKLIWAYIRDAANMPTEGLPGARVRLRGTCLVLSNARRQFDRSALLVASGASVHIVEPALRDPFSLPLSGLNHLFAFATDAGAQPSRVRVTGTVTWIDSSRFFLQDGNDAVQVRINTPAAAHVGDCLDVVGFPAEGYYSRVLEDAVVRACPTPQSIAPLGVNAGELLALTRESAPAMPDGNVVRLSATVLDVSRSAREQVLTLEDGDATFTARLSGRRDKQKAAAVQEGSRIILTGVCLVQVDDFGLPRSFEVLLRSRNDIQVLARPSWLTRSVALKAAAILLLSALAGLLWILLLRRRVRTQTAVIAEQLEREAALEARVRELVEHASDMVYILDLEGKLLHVNYGTERLTGYSRQELLNRSFFELLVPEQRDLARQGLVSDGPLEDSVFQQAEWRFLRKDGREITVEVSQRFQADTQGQMRVEAIGRDVTARKQAMFEDQQRFRTLADNIPQLAWMADATGSTFWYNQRWFDYTGTTSDEVRDWGWMACHHPDHVDRVVTRIRHSFETGESWEDIFPMRGADGQYRWFLGLALPIRDESGRIVRWFGTNTDVTEQKQVEAELQRSNEDLRQFAYIASHDLQEPLRNVCSFAQLLARTFQNGDLSPERSRYIDIISKGARRMESLISDLLAYSRATGTPIFERPLTEFQTLVESAMENLESSIQQSNATITHDPLPAICVNPVHLCQVLQNLFGNSIKYGSPGVPPHIHLRATRQIDGWLFRVQDNGVGFNPEYAERVFGIFKRLHGQEVPGTGIGLAICRAIIERHGGRIWAESQLGRGATFYFTIPDSPSSSNPLPATTHAQPTTGSGLPA